MTPYSPSSKILLRKAVFEKLEHQNWLQISEQICLHLKNHLNSCLNQPLAGYIAHGFEPDIVPFLKFWQAQSGTCGLPVIAELNQPLIFQEWKEEDTLRLGRYNILIPSTIQSIFIPEIILIPLVAFDSRGYRLGRGKGYYDRTLALLRQTNPICQAIGVGCAAQFVETLPFDNYDQRLDAVITETGIKSFLSIS